AFPTQYQNSYFFADWGQGLMKIATFDNSDKPTSLNSFISGGGALLSIVQHPIDGSLYYVSYTYGDPGTVRQLSYTGNRTPVAAASADHYFGPTPLTLQFSSLRSSDPHGQAISYSWNFGDGSLSTLPTPTHNILPPAG